MPNPRIEVGLEEYDERIQLAYAARWQADLAPLFGDLPALHVQQTGGRIPHPRRAPSRSGPSPAMVLIAVFLVAASIGLDVPLFPLIVVFWLRGARHHHRMPGGYT